MLSLSSSRKKVSHLHSRGKMNTFFFILSALFSRFLEPRAERLSRYVTVTVHAGDHLHSRSIYTNICVYEMYGIKKRRCFFFSTRFSFILAKKWDRVSYIYL